MKKIILTIFLISNSLLAEVDTKEKPKLWTFIFARNSTYIFPYEKYAYKSVFSGYRNDSNRTTTNFEFIVRRKLEDTNFSIYFDFFEFNKRDFSQQYTFFQNGQPVAAEPVPIGDYFRSQIRTGFQYSIPKFQNLNILFGARYIKSELSNTNAFFYNIKFGQKYLGPELGIEIQSDKYANFFFSSRLSFFQLYGRVYQNYGFPLLNSEQGFIDVDLQPYSRYTGREYFIKIGYYFSENIFMTIGLKTIRAKTKPNDMRVYSGDSNYDFIQNLNFGLNGNNSFNESFQSLVLEFGGNF